jgi:biopolymer transport protein ExbD
VFSQWESEISISLPSASSAETPGRLPGEVILNVAKDGSVTVNARKLALDDLGARLRKVAEFYPGQPVVIRADRETAYASLVSVIDTCRNAGVWNFSLATAEDKESRK